MAVPLLLGLYDNQDEEQHEHWDIMTEMLLKPKLWES